MAEFGLSLTGNRKSGEFVARFAREEAEKNKL